MKKLLYVVALIVVGLTAGCAYQPLVDVKASKQPAAVQEDQMFCEWLIGKSETKWFGSSDEEMIRRCLKGRGVSVIR